MLVTKISPYDSLTLKYNITVSIVCKRGTNLTRAHNVRGIHRCLNRCQGHQTLCSFVLLIIFGSKIYMTKFTISTIYFCTPVINI